MDGAILSRLKKLAKDIAIRIGDFSYESDAFSCLVEFYLKNPNIDLSDGAFKKLKSKVCIAIGAQVSFREVSDSVFDQGDGEEKFSLINSSTDGVHAESLLCEVETQAEEQEVKEQIDPSDDELLSWREEQFVICRHVLGFTWAETARQIERARSTTSDWHKRATAHVRPSEARSVLDQTLEIDWIAL